MSKNLGNRKDLGNYKKSTISKAPFDSGGTPKVRQYFLVFHLYFEIVKLISCVRFPSFRNITDVSFMILNMKRAASTISQLTSRVSFPVYQEPVSQDIMGMLGGAKDDILIYDRCGLLVKHFSMPYSYLGWPFVR